MYPKLSGLLKLNPIVAMIGCWLELSIVPLIWATIVMLLSMT